MLMLDLCAGLGGASGAMRSRGWDVVTLDYDRSFGCDITADLRSWSWRGPRPDLVWASPPCTEFARHAMPWFRDPPLPDMSLVVAVRRIVAECEPRYWILENVRGAVRFLGQPREIHFPFYLWGWFPRLARIELSMRQKEQYSSRRVADRARVPAALSVAVALACESQLSLL